MELIRAKLVNPLVSKHFMRDGPWNDGCDKQLYRPLCEKIVSGHCLSYSGLKDLFISWVRYMKVPPLTCSHGLLEKNLLRLHILACYYVVFYFRFVLSVSETSKQERHAKIHIEHAHSGRLPYVYVLFALSNS